MGISNAGFGAIVAIVALASALLTFTEGVAARWAVTLVKSAGISLPVDDPEGIIDLDMRWRRGVFIGAAIGTAAVALLSALPAMTEFGDAVLIAIVYGFAGGASIGGLVGMVRAAAARSAHPGPSVRAPGTRLRTFTGRPLIALALLSPLVPIVSLVRYLYLDATIGLDPLGYTFMTSPEFAARILLFALFALNGPVIIAVLAIVSRRRQAAVSGDLLAWDDALFSIRAWKLIYGAVYVNVVLALIPQPSWNGSGELQGYWLPFAALAATLGFTAIVALTRPWQHYLRALWPDVEAARRALRDVERAEKREASRIRREAERRAYNGLPPLSREPVEAEREKYAPFGE